MHMNAAQKYLDVMIDEGYTEDKIADGLSSLGIKFIKNDGKFTIVDNRPQPQEKDRTIFSSMSEIITKSLLSDRSTPIIRARATVMCESAIEYVCEMVGVNPIQAIFLSHILEHSSSRKFDKEDLAQSLGIKYLKLLSYDGEFKALIEKRLINVVKDTIYVGRNTISALATNKPYSIPTSTGLNTTELLREMNEVIASKLNGEIDLYSMMFDLDALWSENSNTGIVSAARELGLDFASLSFEDKLIFYMLAKKYVYDRNESMSWNELGEILEEHSDVEYYSFLFSSKLLELQKKKIIEPVNENGMASQESICLSDAAKSKLFAEMGGLRAKKKNTNFNLISVANLAHKELFYNKAEEEQIRRLSSLLTQDKYLSIVERLKAEGMRSGFNCLFYGDPGTGKTETVYQIAKATGRDIIPINVNEIKGCFYGESERQMAEVFSAYKSLVKNSEVAPILLFNEADAIFGKRNENTPFSTDKTENAIQNIILQGMENLEGILIATTNLTRNLDKAFERRFLYKIKFTRPELEPKVRIWRSMMPKLSEDEANELARKFDFSGGQIENIVRKRTINSIIDGIEPDFAEVEGYCAEECIKEAGPERRKIGFPL